MVSEFHENGVRDSLSPQWGGAGVGWFVRHPSLYHHSHMKYQNQKPAKSLASIR